MRKAVIEPHIRCFDDEIRGTEQRFTDRHSGTDTVGTGFVAGGRDDPPYPSVRVDELRQVIPPITVEKTSDKRAAVFDQQFLVRIPVGEDIGVPPSADGDRFGVQRGVDGPFRRDKKTIQVNVYFHTCQYRKRIGDGVKIWHPDGKGLPERSDPLQNLFDDALVAFELFLLFIAGNGALGERF